MTFKEYNEQIKNLLKPLYVEVDFDNDTYISNCLENLSYAICHRINSPDPVIEKREEVAEEPEGWRR